jgi:hypothetical protein
VFSPALPGHAAAITEMVRAAYARWIPVIGREPRPMTVDYQKALSDNEFTLAYLGDDLAGLSKPSCMATISRLRASW